VARKPRRAACAKMCGTIHENVQYKKRYAAYEYGKGIFFRPNQAGAGTDHLPMHKV